MAYTYSIPRWDNLGASPPEAKKDTGWEVGDRIPAPWLNWYWAGVAAAVAEMRERSEVVDLDDGGQRYATTFKVEGGHLVLMAEEV